MRILPIVFLTATVIGCGASNTNSGRQHTLQQDQREINLVWLLYGDVEALTLYKINSQYEVSIHEGKYAQNPEELVETSRQRLSEQERIQLNELLSDVNDDADAFSECPYLMVDAHSPIGKAWVTTINGKQPIFENTEQKDVDVNSGTYLHQFARINHSFSAVLEILKPYAHNRQNGYAEMKANLRCLETKQRR